MSDEIAIKVESVSKDFKLPHEKTSSIKGALINTFSGKRTFEVQHALKDINFEVKKGEFFGIVGRNGSGKSTLLKLIAGIYTPTKGNITVNGKLTPFIELGVGFNPELTGRDNVFLNGALLGFNRKQMEAMYDEIVDFSELERFMDQKLKNYSSGMQVRLAFSVAIRAQSDILLIDEVLAVGDAAFQRKCFDHFMLLKKNKQTVVLVTHDMGAIRQYCDGAVMIEKGKVVKRGKPEDIAQAYQKLFSQGVQINDKITTGSTTKDDRHWGSNKMEALKPKVTVKDDEVILQSEFVAKTQLTSPIFGFSIFGPTGVNVVEGNTLREKFKTKNLEPGERFKLQWHIPNIFANGNYDISVACCDQSTTEYYDWFNKAASFMIHKETKTAGTVEPPLRVKELE